MSAPTPVAALLPAPIEGLRIAPLLDLIEAQAEEADRARCIDPAVIAGLKGSDIMRLPASRELGGVDASMLDIGRELEAVAARCPSTAWTLWNHQAVFHLFAGALGPDHADFLHDLVDAGEWVSFPAGAGSGVYGCIDGTDAILTGRGSFATGAAYGDWCGVVFAVADQAGRRVEPLDLRFTLVRNDAAGVRIDPTWDGSGLRASATDDIHYDGVRVPLDRCTSWFGANRAESLRVVPVVNHRYREDWVGISDLWLGWMAVGVVRRALDEIATEATGRKVILGARMIDRPTVQLNIGEALARTASARAAIAEACAEVDRRITAQQIPDTADYLRQQAIVSMALEQLSAAMDLLVRTQGGNGLRESGTFERRLRDFRAMPLHINAHRDRITHQVGRFTLGIELDPF